MHERSPSTAEPRLAGRKILVVLPGLALGGAERQALLLARHLRSQEKARVEVWGLSTPGVVEQLCAEAEIPCRLVRTPWPRSWRGRVWVALRFARALRRARPEIVLPYTTRPNVLCGLGWRLSGARLCVWGQRDEGRAEGVPHGWLRLAARATPRFISNSEHGAEFLTAALAVPRERIRHVPNGVRLAPAQHTRREWRARLGLADDRPLAVMVANLHRFKDHRTLLEAWPAVVRGTEGGPILLLAGRRDNAAEALEALCQELGLGEHVRFLGPVDDVAGLLGAIDLAVFSSRYEGCPNAVLEAMAAGLPVVATEAPGSREALGAEAPLAPPGDAAALARLVVEILADPARRARLGAANRARIAAEFNPSKTCAAMVAAVVAALHDQERGSGARRGGHER